MKAKVHGVISIIIIFAALLTAAVFIIHVSLFSGILYLILSIPAFIIMLYSYCAKCSCRDGSCGHIIPGFLTKLLPERKSGKYTLMDYLGLLIGFAWLLLYPQIWLWRAPAVLILFWGLFIIVLVEIRLYVCTVCENRNCYLCQNRGKI